MFKMRNILFFGLLFILFFSRVGQANNFLELWELYKANNPSYILNAQSHAWAQEDHEKSWLDNPIGIRVEPLSVNEKGFTKRLSTSVGYSASLPIGGNFQMSAGLDTEIQGKTRPQFSVALNWPFLIGPSGGQLEAELNWYRQKDSYVLTHNNLLCSFLDKYFSYIQNGHTLAEKELAFKIKERELRQAEKMHSLNLISEDELDTYKKQEKQSYDSWQQTRRQQERLQEELSIQLGQDELEIRGDVEKINLPKILCLSETIEQALANRLDVTMMFLEMEKNTKDLARKKALKGITADFSTHYKYDGSSSYRPHDFKLAISFSYVFFNDQAKRNYQKQLIELEHQEKLNDLKLRELVYSLEAAHSNYSYYEKECHESEKLLQEAEEIWQKEEKLFKNGYSSLYRLEQAQLRYLQARNNWYNQKGTLVAKYLELKQLMGEELEPANWTWLDS